MCLFTSVGCAKWVHWWWTSSSARNNCRWLSVWWARTTPPRHHLDTTLSLCPVVGNTPSPGAVWWRTSYQKHLPPDLPGRKPAAACPAAWSRIVLTSTQVLWYKQDQDTPGFWCRLLPMVSPQPRWHPVRHHHHLYRSVLWRHRSVPWAAFCWGVVYSLHGWRSWAGSSCVVDAAGAGNIMRTPFHSGKNHMCNRNVRTSVGTWVRH